MSTPRTPAVVWVVGDGEGDCLFASSDEQNSKDHFQHCVDEESYFRSGPYTLTKFVPKRDLAAALERAERAEADRDLWKEAVLEGCIVRCIYCAAHDTDPCKALNDCAVWDQQIALDPSVSKEARELRDTYKAERDAAVKDAERLDWAEKNPLDAYAKIVAQWAYAGRGFREGYFNFRHAIDQAIAAKGEA